MCTEFKGKTGKIGQKLHLFDFQLDYVHAAVTICETKSAHYDRGIDQEVNLGVEEKG